MPSDNQSRVEAMDRDIVALQKWYDNKFDGLMLLWAGSPGIGIHLLLLNEERNWWENVIRDYHNLEAAQ